MNAGHLTKKDARNITTSYGYDVLNRLTGVSYSDGTPALSYRYDAGCAANCVGHLVSAGNVNATANYANFDGMGNVLASTQASNGNTYRFGYGYNLAGGLVSESYPSGRTLTTAYDGAGRPFNVAGIWAGHSKNYVSATYWPHGAVAGLFYGNNVVPVYGYNSRLQLGSLISTLGNTPTNYLQVLQYN